MVARCKYDKHDIENKYVGRGITMCDRWHNFSNFIEDMGERPSGTTLDRINNDLGYMACNCRWATLTEQARNRRNARLGYFSALDIAVRMYAGAKAIDVAKLYGVSESLPREIHKGHTWKDAYHAART
jgi:hypothetical protein